MEDHEYELNIRLFDQELTFLFDELSTTPSDDRKTRKRIINEMDRIQEMKNKEQRALNEKKESEVRCDETRQRVAESKSRCVETQFRNEETTQRINESKQRVVESKQNVRESERNLEFEAKEHIIPKWGCVLIGVGATVALSVGIYYGEKNGSVIGSTAIQLMKNMIKF